MGIGNDLIGDLEELRARIVLRRRSLFRMTGESSECWRAERELEEMYQGSRCLLLPSATAGLMLLLEALELEPGAEVLISPFGWLSNWSCLRRAGLHIGFLPLNEQLQLDPRDVEERITERTAAVVVTHLLGRGQQTVAEIAELCDRRGIPLLEDIAQSFGVTVAGRRAGTFGAGAWSSFNHHKVLSAGDGGVVIVRDDEAFARVAALHDQGCVLVDGKRRPRARLEPGLSLRVNDLTAAVLRAQIARYPLIRQRILTHYDTLADALRAEHGLELVPANDGDLPFAVLFRRPVISSYPSMLESGWHVASQVSWQRDAFDEAAAYDPALQRTVEHLGSVGSFGAGFVDPYLAIPIGVGITADADEVALALRRLEDML